MGILIHSDYFRVLSRNGQTPPLHERDGRARKDTVLLRDDEAVEVFIRFTDHSGPWVTSASHWRHLAAETVRKRRELWRGSCSGRVMAKEDCKTLLGYP